MGTRADDGENTTAAGIYSEIFFGRTVHANKIHVPRTNAGSRGGGSAGSARKNCKSRPIKKRKLWCTIRDQEPGYQLSVASARVHVRVNRVDIDSCWFRKSCRLLLLTCPSVPPPPLPSHVVSMCLHVLRQFHRFAPRMGSHDPCDGNQCCPSFGGSLRGHTRSGACGSICVNTRKTHQVLTHTLRIDRLTALS